MRLERHDGYWLLIGPAAPGAAATTFGRLILMRPAGRGDARLLRHEIEHVHQYERHGWLGFGRRYLAAYLGWRLRGYSHWAAYRRVPFEIEAEWIARRAAPDLARATPQPDRVGRGEAQSGRVPRTRRRG